MRIAVITPSLPTRGAMLAEAVESVRAQTLQPVAHLVGVDYERVGSAAMRNALVRATDAEWIAPLDDDDVLYPRHLEDLAGAAENADIIYSYCDVTGRPGWTPNSPFDEDRLRRENYIPVTTLIRRSLLVRLGGWRNSADCVNGWEDADLWRRSLDMGARFVCVPEVTWCYRFSAVNKSALGERAAA